MYCMHSYERGRGGDEERGRERELVYFNLTTQVIIDARVHDLIATEQGINMRGELTDHDVSAICRGEGTISSSEEDSQQGHVSQPVQATSHDWESPVIVHGGLVHPLNMIVEQVGTCTHGDVHVVCLHNVYLYKTLYVHVHVCMHVK